MSDQQDEVFADFLHTLNNYLIAGYVVCLLALTICFIAF